MAAITAGMVKDLREKTGAGMMDCKTALSESNGDMEAAVDWLRAKGLSKAAKKADRVAAEGLIGVSSEAKSGAVVEVNSETDFVARNPEFQKVVAEVAKLALTTCGDVEKLAAAAYPGKSASVADHLKELVATIGENISLRRTAALSVTDGVVATYVHNQAAPGLGKIGVLVALESTGSAEKLAEIGRQIAMHVAATNPLALKDEEVNPEVVERERAIFTEQARESGKPEKVIAQMIEGRIRKFYQEVVLLKQAFVINPDLTVEKAVKEAEKEAGAPITVTGFVRFELGEGIVTEKGDFAAEVAAAAGNQ
ncbi:elongation factor Ts [Rhodomicrobium vannielii ATCC 17100]|uniref:translation elongation factor Ts n=1 Tax=Rhodomicrobium vannielii TaxID=1069 RepID=UPI0019199020|nr:translation elongation factor Ts [Rhodomicrobium vannielii]MBJ7534905.1 elongation factor Ts [Rhodomicrobium vannielii ATCC 17100]